MLYLLNFSPKKKLGNFRGKEPGLALNMNNATSQQNARRPPVRHRARACGSRGARIAGIRLPRERARQAGKPGRLAHPPRDRHIRSRLLLASARGAAARLRRPRRTAITGCPSSRRTSSATRAKSASLRIWATHPSPFGSARRRTPDALERILAERVAAANA